MLPLGFLLMFLIILIIVGFGFISEEELEEAEKEAKRREKKLKETVEEVKKAKEGIDKAWEKIFESNEQALKKTEEAIGLIKETKKGLALKYDLVEKIYKDIFETLPELEQKTWEGVKNYFKGLADELAEIAIKYGADIKEIEGAMKEMSSDLSQKFERLFKYYGIETKGIEEFRKELEGIFDDIINEATIYIKKKRRLLDKIDKTFKPEGGAAYKEAGEFLTRWDKTIERTYRKGRKEPAYKEAGEFFKKEDEIVERAYGRSESSTAYEEAGEFLKKMESIIERATGKSGEEAYTAAKEFLSRWNKIIERAGNKSEAAYDITREFVDLMDKFIEYTTLYKEREQIEQEYKKAKSALSMYRNIESSSEVKGGGQGELDTYKSELDNVSKETGYRTKEEAERALDYLGKRLDAIETRLGELEKGIPQELRKYAKSD